MCCTHLTAVLCLQNIQWADKLLCAIAGYSETSGPSSKELTSWSRLAFDLQLIWIQLKRSCSPYSLLILLGSNTTVFILPSRNFCWAEVKDAGRCPQTQQKVVLAESNRVSFIRSAKGTKPIPVPILRKSCSATRFLYTISKFITLLCWQAPLFSSSTSSAMAVALCASQTLCHSAGASDAYYFETTPSPASVHQHSPSVAEYYPEFEDDAFQSDEEIQKVRFVLTD